MKNADAIVVGAGPGGSSAAFHLARRNRHVILLERRWFPRDKSCGDGLTRPAMRLLDEMGALGSLGGRETGGLRAVVRGQGEREFRYRPGGGPTERGRVVPRAELDQVLCDCAVDAGAELVENTSAEQLIVADGRVVGVRIAGPAGERELFAPVVIVASGAASTLAHSTGLLPRAEARVGFAVREYFDGLDALDDLLEIHLPVFERQGIYLLPSYGWVFPTGPSSANVGIGLFHRERQANVRQLYEEFVERLRAEDPRFARARPLARLRGAPLRFDFTPERCTAPGLALVGDAAGMISPFTGEGISYALESAKWLAEVVDEQLGGGHRDEVDLRPYVRRLAKQYTGYFEAGRQTLVRYMLAWNVLESTFRSDRPLFALARRAALLPEGSGGVYENEVLDDVDALIPLEGSRLRVDMTAVAELTVASVRHEWPWMARLAASGRGAPGVPFRPALLVLLAAAFGDPADVRLVPAAAAVELGYVAGLAQMSVEDRGEAADGDSSGFDWANPFALLIAEFALSKAASLCADVGASATEMMTTALARACEGRAQQMHDAYEIDRSEGRHIEQVELTAGTLGELPCRLGSSLSGVGQAQVEALSAYGRMLGVCYEVTEELRALEGQATQFGVTAEAMLRDGDYPLAVILALRSNGAGADELRELLARRPIPAADIERALELVRGGDATARASTVAEAYASRARKALADLPDTPARTAFNRLTSYALTRQTH